MILFIYKYLWLIFLIIFYTIGWIYAIRQIRVELKGEEEIYDSIYNPFPFYVFWLCLHCLALFVAFVYIYFSSLNYWLTGNISF